VRDERLGRLAHVSVLPAHSHVSLDDEQLVENR